MPPPGCRSRRHDRRAWPGRRPGVQAQLPCEVPHRLRPADGETVTHEISFRGMASFPNEARPEARAQWEACLLDPWAARASDGRPASCPLSRAEDYPFTSLEADITDLACQADPGHPGLEITVWADISGDMGCSPHNLWRIVPATITRWPVRTKPGAATSCSCLTRGRPAMTSGPPICPNRTGDRAPAPARPSLMPRLDLPRTDREPCALLPPETRCGDQGRGYLPHLGPHGVTASPPAFAILPDWRVQGTGTLRAMGAFASRHLRFSRLRRIVTGFFI